MHKFKKTTTNFITLDILI